MTLLSAPARVLPGPLRAVIILLAPLIAAAALFPAAPRSYLRQFYEGQSAWHVRPSGQGYPEMSPPTVPVAQRQGEERQLPKFTPKCCKTLTLEDD